MTADVADRGTVAWRSAGTVLTVLIAWNVVDVVLHVAVGRPEPLRITANGLAIAAGVAIRGQWWTRRAPGLLVAAAVAAVVLNTVFVALEGAAVPMVVLVVGGVALCAQAARLLARDRQPASRRRKAAWAAAAGAGVIALGLIVVTVVLPRSLLPQLHDGRLAGADYWTDRPEILSAGMGFDGTIGIAARDEQTVREAGGSWYASLTCTGGEEPDDALRTRSVLTEGLGNGARIQDDRTVDRADGTPIVFSWPVATDTVDPTDFRFTLNTGDAVAPDAVTMLPNWELNERSTVVAFTEIGNRGRLGEPDAVFPVRLDIVADDSPLLLVGREGDVSAVGLSWETDRSAYTDGPVLAVAKLNRRDEQPRGEAGVRLLGGDYLPNDEHALYDEGDFRLRMLTTGGSSGDGVTAIRPGDYERFFRVHATGRDGEPVLLSEVGRTYEVAGGTLRVVGLAELGRAVDPDAGVHDDDCYVGDSDNYLDVILVGDDAAARSVTHVELPGRAGGYDDLYNPGGPGPDPFDGVRYNAPGPPDLQPVVVALDDPMRNDR